MSAKHAVLGLVIERPGYGYDLARRLEDRCGAWGWERSGVYSALDQLTRDGHVRSEKVKSRASSTRSAPRAIYESTANGVDYFRVWITKSTSPSPVRQELDLKILFSGPEFLPRLIEQTWAQEQMCIDQLHALSSAAPAIACNGAPTWREVAPVLQREAEIKLLQVRVEWLQNARGVMKRLLQQSAGMGAGAR
ncbi:MAG: PadR family transcriptional regulator [Solirubrobacterales bacterium]|nr:PadR family transcriptional regulator [Solirubrobacterales bacterium]